jgi:hypothetical protein
MPPEQCGHGVRVPGACLARPHQSARVYCQDIARNSMRSSPARAAVAACTGARCLASPSATHPPALAAEAASPSPPNDGGMPASTVAKSHNASDISPTMPTAAAPPNNMSVVHTHPSTVLPPPHSPSPNPKPQNPKPLTPNQNPKPQNHDTHTSSTQANPNPHEHAHTHTPHSFLPPRPSLHNIPQAHSPTPNPKPQTTTHIKHTRAPTPTCAHT